MVSELLFDLFNFAHSALALPPIDLTFDKERNVYSWVRCAELENIF